jgi:hypothetical protein
MLKSVLESCDKKFYYGCGGVGDFLLLMATFYDDIKKNEVDVVFGANNCNTILNISKLFPKVRLFRIYPLNGVHTGYDWNMIIDNNNCCGTGVTPEQFNYIEDWVKCGKSNVFDYYGISRKVKWFNRFDSILPVYITVQPVGGRDSNRISLMPKEFIEKLVEDYGDEYQVCLIGSKENIKDYGLVEGAVWITDFEDSIHRILGSHHHYSVNSWTKTFSGLMGIPTTIYPSTYVVPPEVLFNGKKDPSDYVFLDNWGFDYAND